MPPLLTAASPPTATPATRKWPLWLALCAFALLWADLCHQLSYMWSTSEQYAFGWFVPLLALGLVGRNWPTRPAPHSEASPRWVVALVALFALLLLPVRVVHEVNQDWALFSWLLTLVAIAITLYAVFLIGGWPWVKHFAFPICFILVAVRWPYRIENSLTYRLRSVVSDLTVELLGWLNVPAAKHGNLIEVATGTVGVDEACSGIRSFQSSLMAGLFIGELYRLRVWARAGLVLGGLALAFSFNVIRTLFLAWQANAHGLSAIDKWHDTAGMTITVVCFFCLWTLAVLITRWTSQHTSPTNSQVSGPSAFTLQPSAFPSWFSLSLALWVPFVIIANEAWYRSHDTHRAQTAAWWAHFPTNLPGAQEIPISKLARSKLRYDHASDLSWEESDGSRWTAYCFRWDAGVATSRMSARDHRPEYCLGGSGYNCRADLGVRYFPAHGLELPFRTYVFERPGVVLYVFHCIWEDGAGKQEGFSNSKYADRLKTVLQGRRRLGQQTLEIVVSGYQDMAEAEKALRQRLPGIIHLGALPGANAPLEHRSE